MSAFLYFIYFSFRNYLYFSSSINKKSLILHEKNMLAIRIFSRFHLEGIQGGKTMKKEMETTKDAAINHSKSTKVDKTTKVKRSSTQDSILEEKEIQASKLPQETDTACETIKDYDKNHSKATKDNEAKEVKRRGAYRTKAKAGKIDKMPDYLPVITHKDYLSALTINKDSTTHLLLLPDNSKLEYEDKILYLNGQIATCDELTKLSTEDGIKKFNSPLLAELFGVILYKFFADTSKKDCKDEVFTVYYPDLASQFRKSKAKKKKTEEDVSDDTKQKDVGVTNSDWKSESAAVLNDNMALFQRMAGIINAGTPDQFILPLLTDYGYDPISNTFHFRSPYMTKLILEIYKASIEKDEKSKPTIKNRKPDTRATYSLLVDREIAKERNKKAVEIVLIMVALIERAGGFGAHIKASKIVDRTCLLKHSLIGQTTSNKNLMLKRAFSKALQLLISKTSLKKAYRKFQFPDPAYIPVSSMLDEMTFEFLHGGKINKT